MKKNGKRRHLPLWAMLLMDAVLAAAYVGGFYGLYYMLPRQLSNGVTVAEAKSQPEESAVSTGDFYQSDEITIDIQEYTQGSGEDLTTYYVADIQIADIKCLQSGFAENTYGTGYTETVLDMADSANAILAMNGDYYGNSQTGIVIRNGEVYREEAGESDICAIYEDGTMKTYEAGTFDVSQAIEDGVWQAYSFGPLLLDESGKSKTAFNTGRRLTSENPRSAIGYYEPGHYCMVVVDGRQSGYSRGMTLEELSALFEELGCKTAYNLDGGKSSVMVMNHEVVNQPADNGREVSDCIFIKEATQ